MTIAYYACGSQEHGHSRRRFLRQSLSGAAAGGAIAGGLHALTIGEAAEQLKSQDLRVVVFNAAEPLHGADAGRCLARSIIGSAMPGAR